MGEGSRKGGEEGRKGGRGGVKDRRTEERGAVVSIPSYQ